MNTVGMPSTCLLYTSFGLIATCDLVRLIKGKPKNMELILTGRDMPKEILECADLVTEMREVKHPYAPVSYTHLDVYKRQGQGGQSRITC